MGSGTIAGVPGLTPRIGSAAMALVTAATEAQHQIVGFSAPSSGGYGGRWDTGQAGLTQLDISARQRLDNVIKTIEKVPMGGTDCALPMVWATSKKLKFDAFVVYTDNETWHGQVHPVQALQQYRQQSGIDAKLIVIAMVANQFSIADPNDAGMLDCVGFNTDTPAILSDFIRGSI